MAVLHTGLTNWSMLYHPWFIWPACSYTVTQMFSSDAGDSCSWAVPDCSEA